MMEELAGKIWHRFVTRRPGKVYESDRVHLAELVWPLTTYHRALGGARQLVPADARSLSAGRTFKQRVAGGGIKHPLSWQDEEYVYLPPSIAHFPERELNEGLYFWLTALSTRLTIVKRWMADNATASAALLRDYPGIQTEYKKLVEALVDGNNALPASGGTSDTGKRKIIEVLREPERAWRLPAFDEEPFPVPLWFFPAPVTRESAAAATDLEEGVAPANNVIRMPDARKKASRVDERRETDGLLVFQLESLFSWTEQVDLDRSRDEGLDDDTAAAARDLDLIALSRQRKASGARIRFDLDLPPAHNDDLAVGEGIKLPEWDYKKQMLKEGYCLLQPMLSDTAQPCSLPAHLAPLVNRLIPQFAALQHVRRWNRRQPSGDDIDLDGWLDAAGEPLKSPESHAYYKHRCANERDLACLLLADLSLSTETVVDDGRRVIDVIRETVLLFAETLSHTKDRLGIYGFSSVRNSHIRYHLLKNFPECYSAHTRGRIMSLRPGHYTRLGAAIRQSCRILSEQASDRRLLLIISDGKPNDIDQYEGRYGIEDTRHAVMEAKRQGVTPFCITVDMDANSYLPYLFGGNGYIVVQDAARLPLLLPQLYLRLTTNSHQY